MGVKSFKTGIPVCEAIDTSSFNYQSFESSIDTAFDFVENPSQNFEIIEDDLLINGVSIKN
jgi:hypothetical protein